MHRFEVWAPFAKRVSVSVGGGVHAMDGPDDARLVAARRRRTQARHRLRISRRRRCQVLSRSAFAVAAEWRARVFARVRPAAYLRGPMRGFKRLLWRAASSTNCIWARSRRKARSMPRSDKLDYLAELGVTHVELMPVAAFEGRHGWGYDGVALFAVHEPYGGPDGLEALCECGARQRAWPCCSMWSTTTSVRAGNYTGKFGPYVVDSHHTPWGGAVNLEDAGSHEVRRFFCDNALMWLRDYHIDGLRIDAVHAFVDRSAIHFLEQLAARS